MGFSRYRLDDRINGGTQLGLPLGVRKIREMIKAGLLVPVKQLIATGNDRLDTIAGIEYGDASYWWVLAAASEIGWGLQVPPGTVINVLSLKDVEGMIG